MRLTHFLSLKSLAAIGFAIAVIPLALAVMSATAAMHETAALGRGMNCQVFEQTKAIRLALQKTADIERKARLFVLLANTPLRRPYERKAYESVRASFKQALAELQKLRVDGKIALLASELSEKESLIYRQVIRPETQSHPSLPVEEAFIGLREASNILSREFEGYVDRQFDELRGQSESLERELLTKCLALLGVFVAWVGGLLMAFLARPMRQMDASIRKLGAGNFAEPIKIAGISDLRHLGDCLEWLRMRLLEREAPNQPHMENAVDANPIGIPSTHPPSQAMAEDDANELALLPNDGLSQQRQDTPHGRIDPKPQKTPAPREINRKGANFQTQRPLADEA